MKYCVALCALLLSACSSTPSAENAANNEPLDRCESTNCFNQLQIRDFEVVDSDTLIVYVGGQRCAFLVEMAGSFCDLTFLLNSDLVFRPNNRRQATDPGLSGGPLDPRIGVGGTRTGGSILTERADVSNARVCANDLDLGIDAGILSDTGASPTSGAGNLDCRVRNVDSITDDEILEVYVDNRIAAPPPPFGTGEIEVAEPADGPEESATADTESTAAEQDGETEPADAD